MSELDEQRALLRTACRILDHHRVVAGFGHASVRIDERTFLLTPRVGPGAAAPEDFIVLDLDGTAEGEGRVPIEWHIHGAVYAARADVHAIMRVHSFSANVLSIVGEAVRPAHYLASVLRGPARVDELADLVTDADRGKQVATALGADTALLLRGNGQVVVGDSVEQACVRALYLDEAAAMQVTAQSLGRSPQWYSDAEAERFAPTWEDPVNIRRVWDYHRDHAKGRHQ